VEAEKKYRDERKLTTPKNYHRSESIALPPDEARGRGVRTSRIAMGEALRLRHQHNYGPR
jgi:hypothetical protein